MLSSRRVRALTASLLLAVATFVVVVPSAALWEPPTGTTAVPALEASSGDGATAHPHVLRSEAAVSASEALPQRAAATLWWLASLAAIVALSRIVDPRARVVALAAARPRDVVIGPGRGTRAPPHLLL